jgi:hypothetical protein
MSCCLNPHPLSEAVFCLDLEGHNGEHSFGSAAGSAIWSDGDTEWRYRPYDTEGEMLRLHLTVSE